VATVRRKERRAGRVIFISSMAGLSATFGYAAYAPTKWALKGLAQSLSQELLPYNIWLSLWYVTHRTHTHRTRTRT
jgi:3-dehydrosphinganine reductase